MSLYAGSDGGRGGGGECCLQPLHVLPLSWALLMPVCRLVYPPRPHVACCAVLPGRGAATGPSSDLCGGPVSGGGFGECCDTNGQCSSGVCDPVGRFCTQLCYSGSDCPPTAFDSSAYCIPPGLPLLECTYLDQWLPYILFPPVPSDPPPSAQGTCNAAVAYGWSFAPYCSTCRTGTWSGDAGPQVGLSDSQRVATLLQTLLRAACTTSAGMAARCANSTLAATLQSFASEVVNTCSASPAGAALCTFGLSTENVYQSVLLLLGLGDYATLAGTTPLADRVVMAVNMLMNVKASSSFGAAKPSNAIRMADKCVTSASPTAQRGLARTPCFCSGVPCCSRLLLAAAAHFVGLCCAVALRCAAGLVC